MRNIQVVLVCLSTLLWNAQLTPLTALSKEIIEHVNSQPDLLWKATPSKHFKSVEDAQLLLDTDNEDAVEILDLEESDFDEEWNSELPKHFDARRVWNTCPSISEIRDQSSCSSSWAILPVSIMSDRLCIHSNGKITVSLSTRDMLSCCYKCGRGCQGGCSIRGWRFGIKEGVVTGGSKECPTGCQPYPFPKCGETGTYPYCAPYVYPTPDCLYGCRKLYETEYKNDKYYGKTLYKVNGTEEAIMQEIKKNGPVQATFTVYEDFLNYDIGIYEHTVGKELGSHRARMIGWGEEKGKKYWILANSWNEEWGEDGFFRILRGSNHCGIEESVISGMPKL